MESIQRSTGGIRSPEAHDAIALVSPQYNAVNWAMLCKEVLQCIRWQWTCQHCVHQTLIWCR